MEGILSLIILFQLTIDIACFKAEDNFSLCEVYITIPYSELSYQEEEGLLKSTYQMNLKVESQDKEQEIYEQLDRTSYINSYEQAESRDLHILDELGLFLEEGKYSLEVELISGQNKKKIQKLLQIESFDTTLSLSDIELATKIETTEEEGKFVKNGLRVIPHPQAIFGRRYPILYAYTEIYNLRENIEYEVEYSILDTSKTVIKSLPPKKTLAEAADIAETGGINVAAFKEGTYILKIKVTQNGDTVAREKPFYGIESFEKEEEFELTEEELKYYDLIQYLASPKDIELYNSLPGRAKHHFLINFWRKLGRPFLDLFVERIKYVDDHFSSGIQKGRDSDQGRIWIKYGKPDETESYPLETTYRPCEKWIYYMKGSIIFIFVDKSGYGRYELIYSNIPEYPSLPDYIKWINPEILE